MLDKEQFSVMVKDAFNRQIEKEIVTFEEEETPETPVAEGDTPVSESNDEGEQELEESEECGETSDEEDEEDEK